MVIDVLEQDLIDIDPEIMDILLLDRSTGKNICWATDYYNDLDHGYGYFKQEEIKKELISGLNTKVIQPRVSKSSYEQSVRTRNKAEVFTPSWVCNKQNNLIDNAWFGEEGLFNLERDEKWITNQNKIVFPKGKTWKDYVEANRLEVSCGEAPYLVSRYDTVTGEELDIIDRIGMLDRKLRVVNENVNSRTEWFKWVKKAFQSTYGFEYQGDNVLIARENLFCTFTEYMAYKFKIQPTLAEMKEIAKIISWNIWQMDGLDMTVPFSSKAKPDIFITLDFDNFEEDVEEEKKPIPALIYDWKENKSIEFKSLKRGPE